MNVCTSVFEYPALFAHLLYAHIRRLHTVGNEYPLAQCLLHMKNELQRIIRTWRKKRGGASPLTDPKLRLSVVNTSPGWGLREEAPRYTPVSPDPE
ncbi:hypothetical protein Trydic_g21647 [Trypoxylus dichotomus]